MNTLFALTILLLLGIVQARVYSVGLNFRLAEENVQCSDEEANLILGLTVDALEVAGLNMAGNSGLWHNNGGNGNGNANGNKNNGNPDLNRRELLKCRDQANLCLNGALYYCNDCACCSIGRRLQVWTQQRAVEVKAQVEEEAAAKLMNGLEKIGCLKYPPEVICNMV